MISLEGIVFNPSTAQYESDDGQRLSTSQMRLIINGERVKLEGRLLAITERYLSGEITTEEWQRLILSELKESNLIVLIIAAGGHIALNANRQNKKYFEQLRDDLLGVAAAMAAFTLTILAGEKTAGQVRGWVKRQAGTVNRTSSRGNLLNKVVLAGHNEAIRGLGIAEHCPDCPALSTDGRWVAIQNVTPPTMACRCGPNCKCWLITRYNPARAIGIIGQASLADEIARQETRN